MDQNVGKIRSRILNLILGSLVAIAGTIITFYIDWRIDEATEESQQFDSPKQKEKVVTFVEDSKTPMEVREKDITDSVKFLLVNEKLDALLGKLEHQDTIQMLNADQIYQMKEILKDIQ